MFVLARFKSMWHVTTELRSLLPEGWNQQNPLRRWRALVLHQSHLRKCQSLIIRYWMGDLSETGIPYGKSIPHCARYNSPLGSSGTSAQPPFCSSCTIFLSELISLRHYFQEIWQSITYCWAALPAIFADAALKFLYGSCQLSALIIKMHDKPRPWICHTPALERHHSHCYVVFGPQFDAVRGWL